jgi:hypothetical protein
MKKYSAYLISFILIFLSVATVVGGASSANVSATVTVQNVSVSVADGSISYGTLSAGEAEDTTTNGVNDSQTATNDGNITEALNIRGADSTNWTLAGTAGADQYIHKFCTSNCDSSPTWTALTTSNQTLAASVAADGTQVFDLQITVPSTSSSFDAETITVTVQASSL